MGGRLGPRTWPGARLPTLFQPPPPPCRDLSCPHLSGLGLASWPWPPSSLNSQLCGGHLHAPAPLAGRFKDTRAGLPDCQPLPLALC